MSAHLTREEVAEVARLAMLSIPDDELDVYTQQLAAILEHAGDVEALDIDDVVPTHHPYPLANVFRADVVESFDGREQVLANAPVAEDGLFMVPPALGEQP